MITYLVRFLIAVLIVLVVVVLLFALVDRLLKSGQKKVADKTPAPKEKPAEKPLAETVEEIKPQPDMKIYNSELADDLNDILKKSNSNASNRLQIENHMNKEGNIAKYIKSKNYQTFDFGTDDDAAVADEGDKPLSFTREDYKRIVALSNIDESKPL